MNVACRDRTPSRFERDHGIDGSAPAAAPAEMAGLFNILSDVCRRAGCFDCLICIVSRLPAI